MPPPKLNIQSHLLPNRPWVLPSAATPPLLQSVIAHPGWLPVMQFLYQRLIVPNPHLRQTYLELLKEIETREGFSPHNLTY